MNYYFTSRLKAGNCLSINWKSRDEYTEFAESRYKLESTFNPSLSDLISFIPLHVREVIAFRSAGSLHENNAGDSQGTVSTSRIKRTMRFYQTLARSLSQRRDIAKSKLAPVNFLIALR